MSDGRRYDELRDYLRVLREQRLIIIVATLLFVGTTVVFSLREDPVYQASASLAFKDPNVDLGDLGAAVPVTQTPEQRAAIGAQRVTDPEVVRQARRLLGSSAPVASLTADVQARPEARTNLVIVEARARGPHAAADLATAFARATRQVLEAQERRRYRTAAERLEETTDKLPRTAATAYTRSANRDRIARLQSLARFASPVSIAAEAEAPSSPISPKPIRNGLLGLLLGLTAGLVAAFVRDAFDRRFRDLRDISSALSAPLVGQVRDHVLGGSVAESGRRTIEQRDLEAFRIIRMNMAFPNAEQAVKTILVTSALPEEGKTTVASSLAYTYAAGGRRTLILEADLRRPTLGARLGLAPGPGLADHLVGDASRSEIVRPVPVEVVLPSRNGHSPDAHGDGAGARSLLTCITAGSATSHPAELLASDAFKAFLAAVSADYEMVIIDSCPLLPVVDSLELVPHADAIVLCVRVSRTTRDEARAGRATLDHLPQRPVGVVATGVRAHDEGNYGYYSYGYADAR